MFTVDFIKMTEENTNFRKVLNTGIHSQIVAMSIKAHRDIKEEVHPVTDQILFIIEGEGDAMVDGEIRNVKKNEIVFVPAGTTHNFRNTGETALKLLTIYAPPEHQDGTIHKTREEADKAEHE
jgi:mannose-6-phosphate isomerase-like protein (cupin superfamily)